MTFASRAFNASRSFISVAAAGLLITSVGFGVGTPSAAVQEVDEGAGKSHGADPCEHFRDPPGRANGIDKKCPDGGSSSGIARGDFNGDGVADLAVGIPNEDTSGVENVGAVNVIYGSAATGLLPNGSASVPPSQLWSQGSDGVPETDQTDDRFGAALASGDFNGDGFSDLAIGAPGERVINGRGAHLGPAGAVTVIFGSSNGLTASANAGVPTPQILEFLDAENLMGVGYGEPLGGTLETDFVPTPSFGTSLAWGDFDGDGFGDLAVGNPRQTVGSLGNTVLDAGAVAVFFGSEDGLTPEASQVWSQDSPGIRDSADEDDRFGSSLSAGNFDGDSETDLAIGVTGEDDADGVPSAGAVAVLFGGANGLTSDDQLIDQIFFLNLIPDAPGTAAANDRLGQALAAGDFNGDGRDDLAIGAPQRDIRGLSNAGAVFVVHGLENRILGLGQFWEQNKIFGPTINVLTESATEPGDQFGFALAAGDFNFDGRDDLAIGVPLETVVVDRVTFFENIGAAGEVDIVYGSASGLSTSGRAPQQFHQNTINVEGDAQANDNFGRSLTAWNFGRDESFSLGGFVTIFRPADLAIGVPFENISDVENAGAINVLYGASISANGLRTLNDQFFSQASTGIPGTAEANDNFGLAMY